MELVTEISVLRKLKENEILALQEKCSKTFGGECEASKLCMICAVDEDVKELQAHFDRKNHKMDFSKSPLLKTSITLY